MPVCLARARSDLRVCIAHALLPKLTTAPRQISRGIKHQLTEVEAEVKKTYGSAFKQSVASLRERHEESSCVDQPAAIALVRSKRHGSPQKMLQVEH